MLSKLLSMAFADFDVEEVHIPKDVLALIQNQREDVCSSRPLEVYDNNQMRYTQ